MKHLHHRKKAVALKEMELREQYDQFYAAWQTKVATYEQS